MEGRYGPYVTDGTTHATLPKSADPKAVTLDEAIALIDAKAAKGPSKKGGRKPAEEEGACEEESQGMIHIAITRLPHGEGLPLPSYASEGAAGLDVVAAEDLTLAPGRSPRRRDRLRHRHSAGLRGPGAAALGPGAQARHHLPQHAGDDRLRLSRRGEGDPRQSRRRAVRSEARRAHRPTGARAGAARRIRRGRQPRRNPAAAREASGRPGDEPQRRRARPLRAAHRPAAGRRGGAAQIEGGEGRGDRRGRDRQRRDPRAGRSRASAV